MCLFIYFPSPDLPHFFLIISLAAVFTIPHPLRPCSSSSSSSSSFHLQFPHAAYYLTRPLNSSHHTQGHTKKERHIRIYIYRYIYIYIYIYTHICDSSLFLFYSLFGYCPFFFFFLPHALHTHMCMYICIYTTIFTIKYIKIYISTCKKYSDLGVP
ncbi:hypothetical protein, unlikely [Trypanosoma brucei gambiense DAL972]|uniref:Uncharacterized protein n=1 Tax=Trypanosoma brucei gambiense (strain MHOM/CI/86/DAL972) TaxID=679716 RepID=D0A6Y9_TRYB9|nr:hypothetical protein, unlikely [Trypanosoma brucei gambiense DAL972]CBH17440.1 hypothetical protein, unlikely [Trypanosoma brucei gambiense DAL972]|eukprot:XP_011779704.1 hypothetical protein, unlikely [Trypanosoma brucei gambiense DAL972]